jgi:predicted dehydrogenase
VVHNFQFARCAQRLKTAIRNDELGAIKSIYGVQLCNHQRNIPEWCDQLPLGLFYDEAPHFYYLFRWLAQGEMQLLHASVWDDPRPARHTPRMITAEYRSSKDIPVTLHINFESSITEWHVVVVGEKATVVMDVWRDIYIRLPNDGVHSAAQIMQTSLAASWQHWLGVLTGGIRYMRGCHLYGNDEVVRRFYRAIHGEDCLQGMDADEGRRVIELMHEVVSKADHY